MKKLHPNAVWLFFITTVLNWFSFFVAMIVIFLVTSVRKNVQEIDGFLQTGGEVSFSFLNWLWAIVPIFLALCYIWAQLTYHFYKYELTEAGFKKELGVIRKQYITIPYSRIQNVDIYRGIIARLLGLSDLNIQTAGAGGAIVSEARLPAVSREEAEILRDELIGRVNQFKSQGL